KRQKITRGPKPVSKKSNSMWMTSLSQFPLLIHPTRKVQNSRLAASRVFYLASQNTVTSHVVQADSLRGTSVPLERLAGTCGRRAEATPQAISLPHMACHLYSAS